MVRTVSVADQDIRIECDRIQGCEDLDDRLEAYLDGEPVTFPGIVDISDLTHFQRTVLRAIRQVPYGETVTYSELARQIGRPDAVRAVANACGKNPVPIVIPCHRVVGTEGIGGYRYGQRAKEALLESESADR